MTACPQCGSALPETGGVRGCQAPVWALCRECAWPLDTAVMVERLRVCRAEVTTVLMLEDEGANMRTLTGAEALAAVDRLVNDADAVVPVCQSAGLVAFRRAGLVEFVLFDGESVRSALSVMAGE